MDEKKVEPVWGVVANVVDERLYGETGEIRSGTKHFVPGAKVYYHSAFWGNGAEEVTVTGRHRGSSKLVTVTMARRHLCDWRAKLIYKPAILERFEADFYELTGGRHEDPEAAAKELAEAFNRPSIDARAIDKPMAVADDLINSWKADGELGLDIFDEMVADRAMVLYQATIPIGVGKSTSAGDRVSWVHPDYEGLRSFLKRRMTAVPAANVTEQTRLEYATGMTSAAIAQLSELMTEEFDALEHAINEESDTNNRNHLVQFMTRLLPDPESGWPHSLQGHENQVVLAWIEGKESELTAAVAGLPVDAVSGGFQVLKTSGLDLAQNAAKVMKSERNLDPAQGAKLGALLQLYRLQTGTHSDLAHRLTSWGLAGSEYQLGFGRVVACRLATEFVETGPHDSDIHSYASLRARDWIDRGLVDPSEEVSVNTFRSSGHNRLPEKRYQIDLWPTTS